MTKEHAMRKKARDLMSKAGYKAGGHIGRNDNGRSDKAAVTRALGGSVPATAPAAKFKAGGNVSGGMATTRLDKRARGGGIRRKPSTTVNINMAPAAPPMPMPIPKPIPVPMGGPAGPGAGPGPGAPPMPPPGGMQPGGLAGGIPAMGAKPPGMKKGGGVKGAEHDAGTSTGGQTEQRQENNFGSSFKFRKGGAVWHATKLADGGSVSPAVKMDAGSGGGKGRLEKISRYGAK